MKRSQFVLSGLTISSSIWVVNGHYRTIIRTSSLEVHPIGTSHPSLQTKALLGWPAMPWKEGTGRTDEVDQVFSWLRGKVDRAMENAAARSARETIEGLNRDGRAFLLALAAQQKADLETYHDLDTLLDAATAPELVARAYAELTSTQLAYLPIVQRHSASMGSQRGDLLDQLYRGNSLVSTLWVATIRARDVPTTADDVRRAWALVAEALARVDGAIDLLARLNGMAAVRVFSPVVLTDWMILDAADWRAECEDLAENLPWK